MSAMQNSKLSVTVCVEKLKLRKRAAFFSDKFLCVAAFTRVAAASLPGTTRHRAAVVDRGDDELRYVVA